MGPVKFALLGCGRAASFHVAASRSNPSLRFVAAYDADPKALSAFARRHKLLAFSDLGALLESDVDAVLIALPHYLHAEAAIAAARAGKHVLCEKPMANTLEECDAMIEAARRAGVRLMIAENHRFLPAHQYIKETVQSGAIGDVFLARTYEGAYDSPKKIIDPSTWMFSYEKGGGGALHDQGAHKFALLNWILGEVESAQCWCVKALQSPPTKGEDTAMVLLRFRGGAMAEVTVTTASLHTPTNRLELHGTRGSLLEDHDWERPVKVFSTTAEKPGTEPWYSPELEHGPFPVYYTISFRREVAHFTECVLQGKDPEFTPQEAREAVAVVHLAYLAAKRRSVVTMEELKEIVRTKGTKGIFEGLEHVPLKQYERLRWH